MVEEIREWLGAIADPEIPVLSILDLGIVRDVRRSDAGVVTVSITPTYSGCPAMDMIREDIHSVLNAHGVTDVIVETVLSPAWTTDWIPQAARERLRQYGIAPPATQQGGASCSVPILSAALHPTNWPALACSRSSERRATSRHCEQLLVKDDVDPKSRA